MIVKAWFIVAIMSGVYTDGTKDIFIFQHPEDHGHFHNASMCQKFVGDNPFSIMKALVDEYGDRSPEKIICVPEETVETIVGSVAKQKSGI
tara:strand:- start:128 stop:400 length:273 start_codon:yes stop_codon:yes gene_type:complete